MTGMRRGEAAGLRWVDVDLKSARISVCQARVTVGYKVQLSEPKTRRVRRSIALDGGTVSVLRHWKGGQARERLEWGPAWTNTGYVFTREDGLPYHPDRVTKLFEEAVERLNLPRIRLHDLRHTHATIALSAGVHPKVVSERLGHANISITLDTYSHAVPALEEEAAAKLAAMLLQE
jgi:integrase